MVQEGVDTYADRAESGNSFAYCNQCSVKNRPYEEQDTCGIPGIPVLLSNSNGTFAAEE